MNIEKIDRNFEIKTDLNRPGLVYKNCMESPFRVYGLLREGEKFVRMPDAVAQKVNGGVANLNSCTAGGRVRFTSDSPYVAIAVKYNLILKMPHFPFSGSIGFDLYSDWGEGDIYVGSYITQGDDPCFESVIDLPHQGLQTLTLHLPLYSGVDELFIGLKDGSRLRQAPDYSLPDPVVFYGSSITQGGCASRPGNCCDNIISRILDIDHINLGFSGSARAETPIAEYISSLRMSAFVFDYDHNAPSPEYLEATHAPMFRLIRSAQPDLPIILLSRPVFHLNEDEKKRLSIIENTYRTALAGGDKNVYLIPGPELIEDKVRECATVDGCHPNDSGFVSMAYAVGKVLCRCLFLKRSPD